MVAEKQLINPKFIDVTKISVDKIAIKDKFKKDYKFIMDYFSNLSESEIETFVKKIEKSQNL